MDGSTTGAPQGTSATASPSGEELARSLGVSSEAGEILSQAGFTSVQAVRGLSRDALERLGVAAGDAERIRAESGGGTNGGATGSEPAVERWAGSVRRTDRGRRRRVATCASD